MREPEGFAAFYADVYVRVVRTVRPLCETTEDAEDLAQDAFARAYTKWDTISSHAEPEAWVKLVAINLARSRIRRARVVARKLLGDPVSGSHVETVLEKADLGRALGQLPPRQRAVLKMHYLEDLPIKEVARRLGASEASVKTNLHRGRVRLSKVMSERDVR